CQHYSDLLTF
nr:immunoglobulin light chain junction region [Macaca mulatta]